MSREAFERFAVKYWGQKVGKINEILDRLVNVNEHRIHSIDYLQLRSIDSLTDEECVEIAKILSFYSENVISEIQGNQIWIFDRYNDYWGTHNTIKISLDLNDVYVISDEGLVNNYDLFRLIELTEYLRLIGIIVPADGYTVEEILDMGWAKI